MVGTTTPFGSASVPNGPSAHLAHMPHRHSRSRRTRAGLNLLLAASLALTLGACGTSPKEAAEAAAPAEKLYADAKDDMNDGNYEIAIKKLEKVEGRGAGTVIAQQAELDLAFAYYKTGEKAQALAKLERFIRLHPTSPALDYALYLQGLINFNDDLGLFGRLARQDLSERDQQASRDAYEAFRQLSERFPQSRYASDAQERMRYIVNSLAAYEVHVARYYYRRGAYLAAANRAQQTILEFRDTPSVEDALYLAVISYDKLGLQTLRDDAKRVLVLNYPQTRLLAEGFRAKERAWWQFW